MPFVVLTMAGWLNRRQQDQIDYLREENRILREQLGDRPLRSTDVQRRRLAVRGRRLGRRALIAMAGIVLGKRHLRLIVNEYVEYYHHERNHQGLDNQPERTSEFDGANASADC